ncbi:unnamed protein product [Clonostachys rhizophaga]|uniref:Uncharacterized protein n=1 Tax=Clonostachys rhizophaga TaxID=160324 RepID=A0A9N9V6D9_9HYPO|nr:unnamed protein product [Clonostachys rhizophaga]
MNDSGDYIPDDESQMSEYEKFNSEFLPDSEEEANSASGAEVWSKEPRKDGSRGALPGEAAQSIIASADRERLLAKQSLIALTFRATFRSQQKNHDLPDSVPTVNESVQLIYVAPAYSRAWIR